MCETALELQKKEIQMGFKIDPHDVVRFVVLVCCAWENSFAKVESSIHRCLSDVHCSHENISLLFAKF